MTRRIGGLAAGTLAGRGLEVPGALGRPGTAPGIRAGLGPLGFLGFRRGELPGTDCLIFRNLSGRGGGMPGVP